MLSESAQDLFFTPEESKLLVAVFPHPLHGRLIEKVLVMLTSRIEYLGFNYQLSWRDGSVAFYEVAGVSPRKPVKARTWDLAFDPQIL
ncbi:MAG: hypothetical protein FJ134_07360 [Deltaproteobacteria bacterium]|nr:hypothetical protein [Deltaproteobacteria bacterium]